MLDMPVLEIKWIKLISISANKAPTIAEINLTLLDSVRAIKVTIMAVTQETKWRLMAMARAI